MQTTPSFRSSTADIHHARKKGLYLSKFCDETGGIAFHHTTDQKLSIDICLFHDFLDSRFPRPPCRFSKQPTRPANSHFSTLLNSSSPQPPRLKSAAKMVSILSATMFQIVVLYPKRRYATPPMESQQIILMRTCVVATQTAWSSLTTRTLTSPPFQIVLGTSLIAFEKKPSSG